MIYYLIQINLQNRKINLYKSNEKYLNSYLNQTMRKQQENPKFEQSQQKQKHDVVKKQLKHIKQNTQKIVAITQGHIPCYIYLSAPSTNDKFQKLISELSSYIFKSYQSSVLNQFYELIPEKLQALHISMSNVFRLPINQRSSFIAKLRHQIVKVCEPYFPISCLFSGVKVLKGKYITLQLGEISASKIKNSILPKIDKFMHKSGQLQYCQVSKKKLSDEKCQDLDNEKKIEVIFHITLFKIREKSPNQSDCCLQKFINQCESYKVPTLCFSLQQLLVKMGQQNHIVIKKK